MLKIKLEPGQNIWITSDTHYNHKNICRGVTNWRTLDGQVPVDSTRPFELLEHMNSTLVANINEKVGQDDILIHLGDWSFGGFESIEAFRDRIYCKNIHLILGNHDHHIDRNRDNCQRHFVTVDNLTQFELKYTNRNKENVTQMFTLCHFPISSWNSMNDGVIHLHGHVHLPNDKKFGRGKKMDVGVDGHPEFRPYNIIDEIVPLMKKRDIISDMLFDHHEQRFLGQDGR
jgi:calcineurin-like phosphoesterase family protein